MRPNPRGVPKHLKAKNYGQDVKYLQGYLKRKFGNDFGRAQFEEIKIEQGMKALRVIGKVMREKAKKQAIERAKKKRKLHKQLKSAGMTEAQIKRYKPTPRKRPVVERRLRPLSGGKWLYESWETFKGKQRRHEKQVVGHTEGVKIHYRMLREKKVKALAGALDIEKKEARRILKDIRRASVARWKKFKSSRRFKDMSPKARRRFTLKREMTTNEIALFKILDIESPTIKELYE